MYIKWIISLGFCTLFVHLTVIDSDILARTAREKGLSAAKIAQMTGVDRRMVVRMLKGESIKSLEDAESVLKALNLGLVITIIP